MYFAVFDPFIKNNREYFDKVQQIMDGKLSEVDKMAKSGAR